MKNLLCLFLAYYLFSCTAKKSINDITPERKVSINSEINIEDPLSTELKILYQQKKAML